MKFYNPKLSTVSFNISMARRTVQVSMAKTLDPSASGRPTKGQKVYDWEHTSFFSMSPEECVQLLIAWNKILDGTYVDPTEKNDKYKNRFKLTHFRNNQPSKIFIDSTKDQKSGKLTGSFLMTMYPPQGEGTIVSYAFRPTELLLVKGYIENAAKSLEFFADCYEGIKKSQKIDEFNANKKDGDGGGGGNQGGYKKKSNVPEEPEGGFEIPEDNEPINEGPADSGGGISDIDLNW